MLGATRFLVRPPPLPGESLSSWRQRLGWANGYRLYPVKDERTRRTDPDLQISEAEATWLEALSLTNQASIQGLTLRGAKLVPAGRDRHPIWVIPCRTQKTGVWGSGVCPACLENDEIPYIRLEWRLGYVVACPLHSQWLLDACPNCKRAIWPTGYGVARTLHASHTSHAHCWACGFDLRLSSSPGYGAAQAPQNTLIALRSCLGAAVDSATSDEVLLRGLHELCQLVIRLNKSDRIHKEHMVELMPIEDRRAAITSALDWLQDFPNGLQAAAKKHGFSRTNFNGRYGLLPAWLRRAVDHDLAKQKRRSAGT